MKRIGWFTAIQLISAGIALLMIGQGLVFTCTTENGKAMMHWHLDVTGWALVPIALSIGVGVAGTIWDRRNIPKGT